MEYYYEEDKPNPLSVYGRSKLAGEEEIKGILKEYYIIRTAWLYGANGSNFVNTMLSLFKEKESVRVVKDQYGVPTYSKDLAQAILDIIEKNSDDYGVYHFSNIGRTSWFNYAKEIYKHSKKFGLIDNDKVVEILPVKTEEYPTDATRPKNTILCKDKIINVFGIEIRSWIEALEEYLYELSLQNKR
jgi:dTDP-4-dehydrorhamnose reductase